MVQKVEQREVFGLIRPSVDVHTLGISAVEQLILNCGYRVIVADADVCAILNEPSKLNHIAILEGWIKYHKISRLGFSYRLDIHDGVDVFGKFYYQLSQRKLFAEKGGPIKAIYFAGLPKACELIHREYREHVPVFLGDDTATETLAKLAIPERYWPNRVIEESVYDNTRIAFGKELLRKEKHLQEQPVDRSGYPEFGSREDTLIKRLNYRYCHQQMPLLRTHLGPYSSHRVEAVHEFLSWAKQLAKSGFLDVLSIGSSQLTQEAFEEDWGGRPNGGGVPINSKAEFISVWEAARPMLVRTYAGTRDVLRLARIYEKTISIAWHALSFWWFSQLDGRGPNTVLENLREHLETLSYIAQTGKPFEPNIPHHFAFRGADDLTYIVSGVLAAKVAKQRGVRYFILQNMLNTPKCTWGVQDLAKARAMLFLVRELEDASFKVIYQARAGLDCFSPDLEKAQVQLAAVTALMDDVEPHNSMSPDIIHVVNYSEAAFLATPQIVKESCQITLAALREYRCLRAKGLVENMEDNQSVRDRTHHLISEARIMLHSIEEIVPEYYSSEGLYKILKAGFFSSPYLWGCRDEFSMALDWKTGIFEGGINVFDVNGNVMSAKVRVELIQEKLKNI